MNGSTLIPPPLLNIDLDSPEEDLVRLPGETIRAHGVFILYAALGSDRSHAALLRALQAQGSPRMTLRMLQIWSRQHRWMERIARWQDAEAVKLGTRLREEKHRRADKILSRYDWIIQQAEIEWERSKRDFEQKALRRRKRALADATTPNIPGLDLPEETQSVHTETRTGNVAYLNVIRQTCEDQRRFLGLDAPSRIEQELGDKTLEALRGERERILEELAGSLARFAPPEVLAALASETGIALGGESIERERVSNDLPDGT